MKRYISTNYLSGSYLVDRQGAIYEVIMHAPSTTYLNRGITFLAPTDAGFLYDLGKINKYEVEIILWYNYQRYLENEVHTRTMMDPFNFSNWAELQYTSPEISKIFHTLATSESVPADYVSQFDKLNRKWYTWLKNNFVKLSVINIIAEFRITSDDSYDWNGVIIDDIILSYDWKPNTRFNVLKEDETGYKSYFFNATLDDILEDDGTIMSAENLVDCEREVVSGSINYKII